MTEAHPNATCIVKTEVEVYDLIKYDFRRGFETGSNFQHPLQMIYFRRQ